MLNSKHNIKAQLEKAIFPLQGLRHLPLGNHLQIELGPMASAFPNGCFPHGAVHEFIGEKPEDLAATTGFITALLSFFMKNGGVVVWIGSRSYVFPPALKAFNIEPDRILFIDLQNRKDILWVMEETLKCGGLAAVVAELKDVSFTESRRLQLAVEGSGNTGLIIRSYSQHFNTLASVSRWKIISIPGALDDNMPGLGLPRWKVELMKIRNGKPGTWYVEWLTGQFHFISPPVEIALPREQKRKTG